MGTYVLIRHVYLTRTLYVKDRGPDGPIFAYTRNHYALLAYGMFPTMKVPRQFTHLYYITNYAVLAAFFGYMYPFILRPAALDTPTGKKKLQAMGYTSFTGEQEVLGMVLLSLALKAKRCRTGDEFLFKVLMHAKILSLLLSYVAESQVTLGALVVVYVLMFVFVQPPKYKGERKVSPGIVTTVRNVLT